ncbi:MAG: 50S ribosomal protein L18 [Patescibacteria group bacterium]
MTRLGTSSKQLRERRHTRVRAKVSGTTERPRLAIFRSNRFVSAQVIDDTKGHTLASAHGREFKGAQSLQAAAVGKAVAERAKAAGVDAVVFDRGGYSYAAQVRNLADAAREGGLTF